MTKDRIWPIEIGVVAFTLCNPLIGYFHSILSPNEIPSAYYLFLQFLAKNCSKMPSVKWATRVHGIRLDVA